MFILNQAYQLPAHFELVEVSKKFNTNYTLGSLDINSNEDGYPKRSDEKIMRSDIISSILQINKLKPTLNNLEKVELLVANGAFVEKSERHLNRIIQVFKSLDPEETDKSKFQKIYRACPPLLALETLTNSTMSFISQYSGLSSNNTTFGNTSQSSLNVLKTAMHSDTDISIIGSSNCASNFSFLSNSGLTAYDNHWKESSATCFFTTSKENQKNVLCKVVHAISDNQVPSLFSNQIKRSWSQILPKVPSDLIICSGAYTSNENESDLKYLKELHPNVISYFDQYGNLGSSSLFIGIALGIESFDENIRVIDIVDRDIYGRESLIRIEHV
jgi:hypothetical protein